MPVRIRYRPDTFGRKNKQVARIHYSSTVDYDDLLDLASDGARVQRTNIAIAMESLTGAIVRLLADGKRVRTPLGIFELALRGEKHNDEHQGRANRIGRGEEFEFTVQSDAETGLFFVRDDAAAFRAEVYAHVGTNVVIAKCPRFPPRATGSRSAPGPPARAYASPPAQTRSSSRTRPRSRKNSGTPLKLPAKGL